MMNSQVKFHTTQMMESVSYLRINYVTGNKKVIIYILIFQQIWLKDAVFFQSSSTIEL